MNGQLIGRTLGYVLFLEGMAMLLPLCVCVCYQEALLPFLLPALLCFAVGFPLTRIRRQRDDFYVREGFLCVGLSWLALSLFGCLPFLISGEIPGFVDAIFETVSGFSTTGASILTNIEALSHGCLFWRSFTQWIGGIGVLVFVMAVLPVAGNRSFFILQAELPGPNVGRLVPHVRKTALILCAIYIILTMLLFVLLLLGKMNVFDAMLHSLSTAATGGFSNYNHSVAEFNSAYFEIVLIIFMLIFGVNFSFYFAVFTRRSRIAFRNEELYWYLGIVLIISLFMALALRSSHGGFWPALRPAIFQVVSIVTTTGYTTEALTPWPEILHGLLLMLMFMGGCAGSTAGGLKISRVIILLKSAFCELRMLLAPREIAPVRLSGRPVPDRLVRCILAYFFLAISFILMTTLILSLDGNDLMTNFSAALTTFFNVGPGFSRIGTLGDFSFFSPFSKLLLCVSMLLGRLEIYPMLILFFPSLWRRR